MRRDLRFDFFRGIALLAILWVHVLVGYGKPLPPYFRISPYHFGFSGAADIFVFISGFVFAVVYARVMDKSGFGWTYAKALNRAWQLYVANAFTMLLAFGVVWFLGTLMGNPTTEIWHMTPNDHLTLRDIWMLLTFREVPDLFDILKLYIFTLLLAPAFLYIIHKNWIVALALTLTIWAAAQVQAPQPEFVWSRGEGLNPMAWQCLFGIGMILAVKRPKVPRFRVLTWMAWAIFLFSLVRVWLPPTLAYYGILPPDSPLLRPVIFTDHELLGPIRLGHFLVVLYLVSGIVSSKEEFGKQRWMQPIIVTGQNALEVFCFGLLETYVACGILVLWQPNHAGVLLVLLTTLALTVAFAYLIQMRKSEPWRRARVVA